jgi:hypothetical protein
MRAKAALSKPTTAFVIALGVALGLSLAKPVRAQSPRDSLDERLYSIRAENWLVFQRNTDDSEQWQYWPRFFIPFKLSRGWSFTQRLDLLGSYTDNVGPQNPMGTWKAGINDWFIEEIFRTPEWLANTTFLASARFVFPTAGLGPFGTGQYQWAPALGMRYSMRDHTVTFSPLARYFMSYHASEQGAGEVRRLELQPIVTFGLRDGWSLTFYGENAIAYNAVAGKWFVPVDVQVLRRLSKTIDFHLGGAYGVIRSAPMYQYIVNASLAVYFER